MIVDARKREFYDNFVTQLITEKYALDVKDALRSFVGSETYRMLLDEDTLLYRESPYVLFDMWEAEQITGDPRNSEYIRG